MNPSVETRPAQANGSPLEWKKPFLMCLNAMLGLHGVKGDMRVVFLGLLGTIPARICFTVDVPMLVASEAAVA